MLPGLAGSAAAVESGGCAGRAQDARIRVRILPLVGDWQTGVGLAMSVAQVLFCVVLAGEVLCVCVCLRAGPPLVNLDRGTRQLQDRR